MMKIQNVDNRKFWTGYKALLVGMQNGMAFERQFSSFIQS
jgi:hypothetical protein